MRSGVLGELRGNTYLGSLGLVDRLIRSRADPALIMLFDNCVVAAAAVVVVVVDVVSGVLVGK